MIISASRRTDIPAFYFKWFLNRLDSGFLLVKNPLNPLQVSKIILSPENIDCIVFWTKNAAPAMEYLPQIKDYPYYFQFTLNPYGPDIEINVPSLEKRIDTFKKLSDRISPEKIIWRYDPVFISPLYPAAFHIESFRKISARLKDYTSRCMFSFMTPYKKSVKNMQDTGFEIPLEKDRSLLLQSFKDISDTAGISLQSCASPEDYTKLGIEHGRCIDNLLIEKISGKTITSARDYGQRKECLCSPSIDIGAYDSCIYGCKYCYASTNTSRAMQNFKGHNPDSELLLGSMTGMEKITVKGVTAERINKDFQVTLF